MENNKLFLAIGQVDVKYYPLNSTITRKNYNGKEKNSH